MRSARLWTASICASDALSRFSSSRGMRDHLRCVLGADQVAGVRDRWHAAAADRAAARAAAAPRTPRPGGGSAIRDGTTTCRAHPAACAAPRTGAIASSASVGGSSPRHSHDAERDDRRGRPQCQRQRSAARQRPSAGEPPAQHTDAQCQHAAPEDGCPERQQAEQHQQAAAARSVAAAPASASPARCGSPCPVPAASGRPAGRRAATPASSCAPVNRSRRDGGPHGYCAAHGAATGGPAQRIGCQHHRGEQQERRHAEIDGRPVQPLEDVARVGRVGPPAHGLLQRRPGRTRGARAPRSGSGTRVP